VEGAHSSGRQVDEIDIDVTIYTDVNDDVERSYRVVAPPVKGMLIQQREVLKELTGLEAPESLSLQRIDPTDKSRLEAMAELAEKVPRTTVEDVSAFGSVDSCIKKLEEYLKCGATSITICNLSPVPEKTLHTYSEKIIPYLRETYSR
jgi:alkanesulfonate monooxygenase SsuD/methylene tetrahydromethanopterin reductase-like flavin-dependent oxidoreductase (luciferase family)